MNTATPNQPPDTQTVHRVAYTMSRFPKISETFILYEILELERLGLHIEIFPLLHEHEAITHADVDSLMQRVHYSRLVSPTTIAAQLYWLRTAPATYLRTWWNVLKGNIFSFKFLLRAFAVVPIAAQFARHMQHLQIDHIHAHWATHPTLAAYVVRSLTGISYSFTAHAHDIYVDRTMLAEKIRNASFVVTISDYNRRMLCELYPQVADEKVVIIHCGIDPSVFQPHGAQESNDRFTIICVASLEEKKGHPYLIEACAMLRDQGVPFRCILIGDGPDRTQIEASLVAQDLTGHIELLGRQPRHRVSALLAESDMMVLPSITAKQGRKEGIPVALMEAMATGLPVVATNISGIPELVHHEQTGLLVSQRDPEALFTAISRLYHDPSLRLQLGKGGREKVHQEFDLHHETARLYHLFTSLQDGHTPVVPAHRLFDTDRSS